MPLQQIHRYVKVDDSPGDGFSTITLYEDQAGTQPTDGRIEVPRGSADITWAHATGQNVSTWRFNSLVIHPLGDDTSRVDLEWFVEPEFAALRDNTGRARNFSYTLGLEIVASGKKVYLDPQLVNVG